MDLKLQLDRVEKKLDRILELLEEKGLSNFSKDKINKKEQYSSIKVGELTDKMERKFNLGPYSK
ncbi:hypothetical protein FYJ27_01805 [Anaerosalibacter bizertensis]|uniref:Uncharacterized protein n=1 Tax=Anaerosalibacter bizertensis TaxID=932217 RepID=A0A844FEQ0_9FIRM|nr:hypothetical protein [Anaerosalibacter bizertensis]MSS42473.1 hypothetical protein [Anaerosalibacter bizertensis]